MAEHGIAHEPDDIKPGAVSRVALALLVTVVVSALASLGLFRLFARMDRSARPAPPPLARHQPGRMPPPPRLQEAPLVDIEALRAAERRILTSYGWVDRGRGTVHMPIDEAMRLYAERQGAPPLGSPAPSAVPSPAAPPAGRP